jgi:hypothetical protein
MKRLSIGTITLRILTGSLLLSLPWVVACSGTNSTMGSSTGGEQSIGGSSSVGGSNTTGGTQAAGGMATIGGATAAGGATASGSCGGVDCIHGSQYCHAVIGGYVGNPGTFTCMPLPSSCGSNPSCACLAGESCGGNCTQSANGDLFATCQVP